MFDFPMMWLLFGILAWVFLIKPARLRACQGSWSAAGLGGATRQRHPRESRSDLEGALAERDALIAKLEERVRVLERIATDPSARLRAEIDSLRGTPTNTPTKGDPAP
jgi:hypothetical protein